MFAHDVAGKRPQSMSETVLTSGEDLKGEHLVNMKFAELCFH